jgi:hypothetical protein
MTKEYNKVQAPYQICEDYRVLAGPYDKASKHQMKMLDNVVNDMRRGNIDYRVVKEDLPIGSPVIEDRVNVERRGMIIYKL